MDAKWTLYGRPIYVYIAFERQVASELGASNYKL